MAAENLGPTEQFLAGLAYDLWQRGELPDRIEVHPNNFVSMHELVYVHDWPATEEPEVLPPITLKVHTGAKPLEALPDRIIIKSLLVESEDASLILTFDKPGQAPLKPDDQYASWFIRAIGRHLEAENRYPADHELMVCLGGLLRQGQSAAT